MLSSPSASQAVTSSADESAVELLNQANEKVFSEPTEALELARLALSASRTANEIETEIKSLYLIGELMIRSGSSREAGPILEDGLSIAQREGFQPLTAHGYYHLSRFHESNADFAAAIEYALNAMELFTAEDMKPNVANSVNSLGRIYQELGDYAKALEYLFEALRINEELDRKTGMAVSYTIIGNTHLRNDNYAEAARYFHEALALDEEMEDKTGIMISKLNLGAVYQRNEEFETAMQYHRETLELARELGYREDEAIILDNIGTTHRKLGMAQEGLSYMYRALEIMRDTGYNITPTLNGISEAHLALENPEEALNYALMAEKSGLERQDPDRLKDTYLNIAAANEALGDFRSANSALRQYNSIKDSLFTIEREKQISELEILYETEKREQTIDLLTLEAETASFRRNTYLASGILISMILLLLYSGQHYKTRKNRQLLEKSEEVGRMKSTFFSNISHEFRTPLTLISGPIEKIKSTTNDPIVQKELMIMQKNSDRLLSLINQLLDLSQLESGSLSLSVQKTSLISLIKGVTMSFQSLADMRNITLNTLSGSEFTDAFVDRGKMETILINLVGNAIKFSPDGGEVTVKISESDKYHERRCRIEVTDSGAGIPESEMKYIFDRFYRGSDSEQSGISGSGIGLALTRELVRLHKGEIEVKNLSDNGSVFTVYIPVLEQYYSEYEKIPESPVNIRMNTGESAAVPDLGDASEKEDNPDAPLLLLIEDNEDVMNYLKDILSQDYRIVTAPDGDAGIKTAFEEIPDLIISDVMMPKMDGYQVAEKLKLDEKTSHIPLVLLTAKASHEDKLRGLQTHADVYLTKPFRPDELLVRVKNLIESRKALRKKYSGKMEIKPDQLSAQSMEEAFLLKLITVIKEHLTDEDFSVERLANETGMSRSQLHRKLVALTDQSASEFIRSYRLNMAMDMISNRNGSISEIAYAVGFNSPSYFSKAFREKFGVSPSDTEPQSGLDAK